MGDKLNKFVASGCYFGLSPIMPGTCGAIPGVIIIYSVNLIDDPRIGGLMMSIIMVTLFWLNFIMTDWAQEFWKEDDPRHFVIDEIIGVIIAISMAIGLGVPKNYLTYINVFIMFRIFDIIKVWPANVIDRQLSHTHFDIVADDLISGIYAGTTVAILRMLL